MHTSIDPGTLKSLLPFLIPIILIEVGLMLAALIHIFTHTNYKVGNRILWIIIVILVNIIGPILYFIIGRGENE